MQLLRDGKSPSEVVELLGVSIQKASYWKRRLVQLGEIQDTPQVRPSKKGVKLTPREKPTEGCEPLPKVAIPPGLSPAEKFIFVRLAHNLRQKDVARLAGVNLGMVALIESGARICWVVGLKRVADMLNISMEEIVPPPEGVPVHEQVMRLRVRQGLTKKMLADRVGLSNYTIHNLERGCTFIKESTIRRVLDALQASP